MTDRDLHSLVRQHAMTSRLLGVDFVPCYRAGVGHGLIETKPSGGGRAADPVDIPVDVPVVDPVVGPGVGLADQQAGETEMDTAIGTTPAGDRLEALRARYIRDAPHEQFVTDHHSIVFGEGDPEARLMFIGEAPGAEEDRTGRPFVGRAGQLLDKMIAAMGLRREDVYIANVLKTRPPNNQTPTLEEARLCAPYLFEQIRIVSPEVIVTLGKSASQLVLGTDEAMGRMRGHWAEFPPPEPLVEAPGIGPIPVMPTYHPAFLLRQYTPENRARVWSDLQEVMRRLGLPAGG